jgi:hypothetical protein
MGLQMLRVSLPLAAIAVLFLYVNPTARADLITGVVEGNGDRFVTFDSTAPGTFITNLPITGLQSGEHILGLDRRPLDGGLYAIGSTNRVYEIIPSAAHAMAAIQVGSSGAFTLNGNIGLDFDPVTGMMRVDTDSGQNLRIRSSDGTLASTDTPLAYAAGDSHFGATPSVVGLAYSNNVHGVSTTQLYGIDSNLGTLILQSPADAGTLQTVGSLGVSSTISTIVSFDIAGSDGTAFAALTAPAANNSQLYTIDLSTGAATLLGDIGTQSSFDAPLIGLTTDVGPASAPEPSSLALVGIGGLTIGYLVRRKPTAQPTEEATVEE